MTALLNIDKKLIAVHCSVLRREKKIVFRYKQGRWDLFESLRPWDIPEALRITLSRIEDAVPGALAKAAKLDDKTWQSNKRRTRRYIAEHADLIYIDSPHLQAQSQVIDSYHVPTNIPWRDVPSIFKLACTGGDIEYCSLASLSF